MFRPLHKLKGFSISNGRCYCDFANSPNQNENFKMIKDKHECENPESWGGRLSLEECQQACRNDKDCKSIDWAYYNYGRCQTINGVKKCSCYLTKHDCSSPVSHSAYRIYGRDKGICEKHDTYRRYDFTEDEINGFYSSWFKKLECPSGYENTCTDNDKFDKEDCCKLINNSVYTEDDAKKEKADKDNQAENKRLYNINMKENECKEKINPFTKKNYTSCDDLKSKEEECRNDSVDGVNFENCLHKKQYQDNKNSVDQINKNRESKDEIRCKKSK